MALISLSAGCLSFGDVPLLQDAELHLEENERVCLVGRNGAGKSTLLKVLSGEQHLDDGQLRYAQDLVVARLQQDPPRTASGTVFDFVAEGLAEQADLLREYHTLSAQLAHKEQPAQLRRLAELQEKVEQQGLWHLEKRINDVIAQLGLEADTLLSALSGGWLRKAALARALVTAPDVLLLDEPTNHLDIETIT
ncbi:MAG: ATP-binding cassette domain-containing protein, partial [Enterobacteriaceae bacterium]